MIVEESKKLLGILISTNSFGKLNVVLAWFSRSSATPHDWPRDQHIVSAAVREVLEISQYIYCSCGQKPTCSRKEDAVIQ